MNELELKYGERQVAAARHAHRLMDVSAAGERVADAAADAGSSATERFDLGGVVVCFVLEHQQDVYKRQARQR